MRDAGAKSSEEVPEDTGKEEAPEDTGKEPQPSFLHGLPKFMDTASHYTTQKATVTSSLGAKCVLWEGKQKPSRQSPTRPLSSGEFWLLPAPLIGRWDMPWCPSMLHLKSHMGSTSCKERQTTVVLGL